MRRRSIVQLLNYSLLLALGVYFISIYRSAAPTRIRLSDLRSSHHDPPTRRGRPATRPGMPNISVPRPNWNPWFMAKNSSLTVPKNEASESFAAILSNMVDLHQISPILCSLKRQGHTVHVLLVDEDEDAASGEYVCREDPSLVLAFDIDKKGSGDTTWRWLSLLEQAPTVLFTIDDLAAHGMTSSVSSTHWNEHDDHVDLDFMLDPDEYHDVNQTWTRISIPRSELQYTAWMKSLTGLEWRNWHIPHVDVTIITHSRPQSLERLLGSLSRAKYFGDQLNIRINMEDSSDRQTADIVDTFVWPHGSTSVHHRIVHGGLLVAVVESWYPHGNHSYELLLEDDIELSPLWYAWVKMTLLKYRYSRGNVSPLLFGISLYQQKNLELPLAGRQPFHARDLFTVHGFAHPSTPYLSQIPCSWGAVYFPEQWREFHQYLALRFSQPILPSKKRLWLDAHVVKEVRSNRWTKSWKKFFIEMVHLRGYVMLYPNYADFASLSTNHLEIGSHVREKSRSKQELFTLPLMSLPSTDSELQLLHDLPDRMLPSLTALPVLNLTGAIASGLDEVVEVGRRRREELFGCNVDGSVKLLCS